MPEYWVGVVLKIKAFNEDEAGVIATEIAQELEDLDLYVIEARWDNNYPEECIN